MALSNHPLAFPTMACAWVIFGKAPTRMLVVSPWAHPEIVTVSQKKKLSIQALFTLYDLQPPWGGRWRIPFLEASLACVSSPRPCHCRRPGRREWCSPEFARLRHAHRETLDTAPGDPDRGQSTHVIVRHLRTAQAGHRS